MPRFCVTLVDRKSGKTTAEIVTAASLEDVPREVDITNYQVSKIEKMSDPPPAAVAETGNSISAEFRNDAKTVFETAKVAVAQLGYKLDSADPAAGIICFKSGMSLASWAGQEMSLLVSQPPNARTMVTVTSRRNQSGVVLQIYDWGEGKNIARKVLRVLGERLPTREEPAKVQTVGPSTYKVIGVDRETGMDCSLVVRAETEANARVKAELKGMVVTEVRPQ